MRLSEFLEAISPVDPECVAGRAYNEPNSSGEMAVVELRLEIHDPAIAEVVRRARPRNQRRVV